MTDSKNKILKGTKTLSLVSKNATPPKSSKELVEKKLRAKKERISEENKTLQMAARPKLSVFERRRHPRFLLSREQFRETKTGRIYQVYDLSFSGLSLLVNDDTFKIGQVLTGILNLHPDSIEISPRVVAQHDGRVSLSLDKLSVYGRTVLARGLSPKRLGSSLKLVRERLPLADLWFHGVCNTDVLISFASDQSISKFEIFISNFYVGWSFAANKVTTAICQTSGLGGLGESAGLGNPKKREALLTSGEPVTLDGIDLKFDVDTDREKVDLAQQVIQQSVLETALKTAVLACLKI